MSKNIFKISFIVLVLLLDQAVLADKKSGGSSPGVSDSPEHTRPAPTQPIIKLNPPKSVTDSNPELRNSMRIDLGGKQLKLYKQDSAALTRLKQELQLFESKLLELDRFAGGQSSRIQRCMSASYTSQQQTDAGCGPGTSISQCSYMLLVNCMGGAEAMNRNYQNYMNKLRDTDGTAENVMGYYGNMKYDIATALAALGLVSESSVRPSPEFHWPSLPLPGN